MREYELFLILLAEKVYTAKGLRDASDFHAWLLAPIAEGSTGHFTGRILRRTGLGLQTGRHRPRPSLGPFFLRCRAAVAPNASPGWPTASPRRCLRAAARHKA